MYQWQLINIFFPTDKQPEKGKVLLLNWWNDYYQPINIFISSSILSSGFLWPKSERCRLKKILVGTFVQVVQNLIFEPMYFQIIFISSCELYRNNILLMSQRHSQWGGSGSCVCCEQCRQSAGRWVEVVGSLRPGCPGCRPASPPPGLQGKYDKSCTVNETALDYLRPLSKRDQLNQVMMEGWWRWLQSYIKVQSEGERREGQEDFSFIWSDSAGDGRAGILWLLFFLWCREKVISKSSICGVEIFHGTWSRKMKIWLSIKAYSEQKKAVYSYHSRGITMCCLCHWILL